VRSEYRFLPVILMTHYGSETTAVEALERGAASYVPKSVLDRELLRVLDEVLTASATLRHQALLRECITHTASQFVLPNDEHLISPLTERLEQDLVEMGFADNLTVIRVAVALREAVLNAMHHGNLEVGSELRLEDDAPYFKLVEQRMQEFPYRERRVYVEARHTRSEAVYVVRDEGAGFDPSAVPDPRDPGNLDRPTGRGLLLIRSFMDEMWHNVRGNEITMIKRADGNH
jgi:anti-sigma regulatory factor (Ser/Thr protein kinase)